MTDYNSATHHKVFVEAVLSLLRPDVEEVTRTGDNTIEYTDGQTKTHLTALWSRVTKPGTVLEKLEENHTPHSKNEVVTQSKSTAAFVAKLLTHPAVKIETNRSQLYNTTRSLTVDENPIVIRQTENPQTNPIEWWYNPSKTTLITPDDRITFPTHNPTEIDTIDLPRVTTEDDDYVVVNADGHQLATFGSRVELHNKWQIAREPHVPTTWLRPEFTISYLDDGEIVQYDPKPRLDDQSRTEQIATITREVIEEQTVVATGSDLERDEFVACVQDYASHLTGIHPRSHEIPRALGSTTEIGLDCYRNVATNPVLAERTWRYPIE